MKQESRNRLSHVPCEQSMVNTVGNVCSTVASTAATDGFAMMTAEQHTSLVPAWSAAASQTELSSSINSAGISTVSSQCSQNAPMSGLSHASSLPNPSQAFAGYDDVGLQSSVQNPPSANISVC